MHDDGMTAIPLRLAGNQTAIIAFSDKLQEELPTPRRHVLSIPSNVLDVKYSLSAGLNLHVGWSDTIGAVCLSDDEKIVVNATSIPRPFSLSNWTLVLNTGRLLRTCPTIRSLLLSGTQHIIFAN